MWDTLSAVFTGSYFDTQYEVDGIAPLPVNDCVWHLKKLDFQVDEKLDFHQRNDRLGVEVAGYLAPQTDDQTLIRADVYVRYRLNLDATLVLAGVSVLLLSLLTVLTAAWSMLLVLSPLWGIGVLWGIDRLIAYRRSRQEADRIIEYLHRRFRLDETP